MTLNGEHHRPFARSPKGHTKTFMLLHGCKRQLLDRLVRAKLATASTYRVERGRQIEITRIKLTEAGRATLSKAIRPVVPQRFRYDGKPPED